MSVNGAFRNASNLKRWKITNFLVAFYGYDTLQASYYFTFLQLFPWDASVKREEIWRDIRLPRPRKLPLRCFPFWPAKLIRRRFKRPDPRERYPRKRAEKKRKEKKLKEHWRAHVFPPYLSLFTGTPLFARIAFLFQQGNRERTAEHLCD